MIMNQKSKDAFIAQLRRVDSIEINAKQVYEDTLSFCERTRADLRQYCSHEWRTVSERNEMFEGEMVCDVCGAKKRI
jgi:hypothetical protein